MTEEPEESAKPPKRVCGAATLTCHCGHKRNLHLKDEGRHYTLGCGVVGCECQRFLGKPHQQATGLMRNGRCRMHGGASLAGIASGTFKTGLRCRSGLNLPETLQKAFAEAFEDPELLSLRRQIALHEARETELANQLGDAGTITASVQGTWSEMKEARRRNSAEAIAAAWHAHDAAMASEGTNRTVWVELRHVALLIVKLKDRENERLENLHQRLSREQAVAFIRAMSVGVRDAVSEAISDPVTRAGLLRAIATRFALLTSGGGPPDLDATGTVAGSAVADSEADD
jgi:hypothetical protein